MDNYLFQVQGFPAPAETGPNIKPKDKQYASKTRAWMTRDVWRDYQERFQPYEARLLDAVTGEELLDERLSAISINNQAAFDAASQASELSRARYGTARPAVHQQAADRNMHNAQVVSRINAENQTRTHIDDRDMNALAGSGSRQAMGEM